jgi:uncharacterized phage protein gp47/JayE
MDFSAEGILARMKADLKNEDTKVEGSFSMDNLQAVSEELARINTMRIAPLMSTLTEKEDNIATSGNEKHYEQWAKEAVDSEGRQIAGNARARGVRDGTGLVSIAILTTDAQPPTEEQIAIVQEYIDGQRPVGADPVVYAATEVDVSITCSIKKESGYSDESVTQSITKGLQEHITSIAFQTGESVLNFYTVSNIINKSEGVSELVSLTINGDRETIAVEYDRYFVLKEVNVSVIE